jgi:Asp-tRNA(Asn)/Glu-tRNA(Gln) amidotransferase A subunit family amidase
MASSIDDLALAYAIMAQPDPENRGSALFPNPALTSDLATGGKKYLGICEPWINRADADVRKMFDAAVAHYIKAGYERVNIVMPYLPEGQKAHALTILSEVRSGITPEQISKLTYPNQLLLNVAGGHATAQDFLYAQRLRDLQMRHLAYLWEEYPGMVIFTPTTPGAGWKIGNLKDVVKGGWGVSDGDKSLKSMEYVYLANWTGCPAISCPMGYTEEGVPVGMMVSLRNPFPFHWVC